MSVKTSFIAELKQESASSKKILERVPIESASWKPHEKSMTIGRLATHIAENSIWIANILSTDEIDFASMTFDPYTAKSSEELLDIFQKNIDRSMAALEAASDEDFDKIWTVKNGGQVISSLPKKECIRGWAFNHICHHRGQLTVFLRLLDVPVPGIYGPSADER